MPRALVVGGGGREHAIVRALARSPSRPDVLAVPGNPGVDGLAERVALSATDVHGIAELAAARAIDLVVIGPEAPLMGGLADLLRARGIAALGPDREAARLEGSKSFAKSIMDEAKVPTAKWGAFDQADVERAVAFARDLGGAVVVKADGLAAGKGVIVAGGLEEAEAAIRSFLGGALGSSGSRVVVEEKLEGEELSVLALTDGAHVALLPPAQDHKRVGEGDTGPNTGGMGAYAPAPIGTPALLGEILATCVRPVLEVMERRGTRFSGVLYAGLMITRAGPRVLEYNVRFGDPETQAILPILEEDVFSLLLDVARGRLAERPLSTRGAAVTVVLAAEGYPGTPRTGDPIRGVADADAIEGVVVHHAGTRRDGGELVTAGGRVLAVTGTGPDLRSAADRAYAGVSRISWPGMILRRDIGWRVLGAPPV